MTKETKIEAKRRKKGKQDNPVWHRKKIVHSATSNQNSVLAYLMTFAAPTALSTLEVDLVPIVSNSFSAETELSNAQCKNKCTHILVRTCDRLVYPASRSK